LMVASERGCSIIARVLTAMKFLDIPKLAVRWRCTVCGCARATNLTGFAHLPLLLLAAGRAVRRAAPSR
jgi:hypothetical protein